MSETIDYFPPEVLLDQYELTLAIKEGLSDKEIENIPDNEWPHVRKLAENGDKTAQILFEALEMDYFNNFTPPEGYAEAEMFIMPDFSE